MQENHQHGFPLPPTIMFAPSHHDLLCNLCYFAIYISIINALHSLFYHLCFVLCCHPLFHCCWSNSAPSPGCLGGCAKRDLEARAVSLLSLIDLSSFTSFTQFTRAAYCPQSTIKNWNCRGKLSLFLICDQDQCLGGWGMGSLFPSFQEPAVPSPDSN